MLALVKVAVTGGIASGKTTVCKILKELGAHVESADEIVHQLLSSVKIKAGIISGPQDNLGNKIITLLGPDVIVNDQLDRSQIAKKVFENPKLLKSLEQILHPNVRKEIDNRYQQVISSKKTPLFVVEIPLLFESEMENDFDYTVAVVADEDVCKQRFVQHSKYDAHEFEKRYSRQLPMKEKTKRANFVIHNDGSLDDLYKDVKHVYTQLKR